MPTNDLDRRTPSRARSVLVRARLAAAVLVTVLAVLAAGCGGGPRSDWHVDGLGSSLTQIEKRARSEGRLDLVLRPGYAVGSWSRSFTAQTGCGVEASAAASPDDLVHLIGSGRVDGALAAGDVSLRAIARGDVAPVNFDLVPGYADVDGALKGQPYDTVEGVGYGVPQGRAANLEVYRDDIFPSGTDSWDPLWSPVFKGAISMYDDPMVIADAALYLKTTKPGLRIANPYELDQRQFDAALRLLRQQRPNVGQYWQGATVGGQRASFASVTSTVGIAWPKQVALMRAQDPPVPVTAIKPTEGTTGWADVWMITAGADHPNCMYLWLDYVASPEANGRIAQAFGEAPANPKACDLTSAAYCTESHADDEEWWSDVYPWTTPQKECGDSRGETCVPYDDWRTAWADVRAGRPPSQG